MVCETPKRKRTVQQSRVLILVLVEDGLRDHKNIRKRERVPVLILVLMEDGLRVLLGDGN